ncbi:MAG TPA: ParB N-terminal domain-containing protein, partial [Archangium sp.]|nr:ParB N-terminal domain-containing protein [Archangium sp.]
MAAKSPRKKAATSTTTRRPRRKKAEPASKGLSAAEVASEAATPPVELMQGIQEDGGQVLSVYRDPLGAHTVVFAALPIDKVEPTPYQRDLSEPHVKRLAGAMERLDRFLDPIIAIRKEGRYWTPNGNHRLHASKLLGGKSIMALVLPEEDVAYQILALNTEKAHNLKERSLEVIRMHRGLTGAR